MVVTNSLCLNNRKDFRLLKHDEREWKFGKESDKRNGSHTREFGEGVVVRFEWIRIFGKNQGTRRNVIE